MHCVFCDSVFTSQMVLSFNIKFPYFDCKTKLCLIVSGCQRKYIFTQESFCLQGILNDINERTHLFLTVNTST